MFCVSNGKDLTDKNSDNSLFGGSIFSYLSPYILNFRYFEIKPLVSWTSNLRSINHYYLVQEKIQSITVSKEKLTVQNRS